MGLLNDQKAGHRRVPFHISIGTEGIIPAEVTQPTLRSQQATLEANKEQLQTNLDLVEERKERAHVKLATYQQQISRYYNKRVCSRSFREGNFILFKVL